jgi:chromosome segregation ATPase
LNAVREVKEANEEQLSRTLAKVEQVTRELTDRDAEIAVLTAQVRENERRNDLLMEEIKDLKRLEKVIEDKEKQFSVVRLQLNEATAEIRLRDDESFRLTTENTSLQAEVDQNEADEKAAQDKLASIASEKEKVDHELEEIKEQLTKKKKKKK